MAKQRLLHRLTVVVGERSVGERSANGARRDYMSLQNQPVTARGIELLSTGTGRIVRGGRPVLAPVYPVLGIRASDTLYPARGRELPPR